MELAPLPTLEPASLDVYEPALSVASPAAIVTVLDPTEYEPVIDPVVGYLIIIIILFVVKPEAPAVPKFITNDASVSSMTKSLFPEAKENVDVILRCHCNVPLESYLNK